MYVRVTDGRVETCPISGTIARGIDPISDAAQILQLLNSAKDESELTMCTDVDRNDKSRICAGSVRVIGRRQIEMYSRLTHTVDHVRPLARSIRRSDAFAHTGGDGKLSAQDLPCSSSKITRKSPRARYGGAVGLIGFDGNMNTGLTREPSASKTESPRFKPGPLLYD
jgi:anthranilate synthase